jgi:pimeloyl-ACP methyl ester carboxylesterase
MAARRLATALLLATPATAPRALAQAPSAPGAPPPLEHFTVPVDGHPVAVWARRPAHPRAAILFVHGHTWSARPDFDLQVPGEPRSVLEAFAARGYAAYALDLRGYGATPRDPTGWATPDRCAADVAGVLQWVHDQAPSLGAPALFGWSEGSTISQLVAQRHPELMSALVLIGYWADPDSSFARDTTHGPPPVVRNTAQAAASDFITPAVIDDRVKQAYVQAALADDPVTVQWHHMDEYNALDPAKVHVRTLLLQGQFDPIALTAAQARFFTRLGTADREWVTIAGGDHAAILESTQPVVVEATVGFLERVMW